MKSVYYCLEYRGRKTSLPWLRFKADHALRREENEVEFLEGRFLDEKLPFLHKTKAEHSLDL